MAAELKVYFNKIVHHVGCLREMWLAKRVR